MRIPPRILTPPPRRVASQVMSTRQLFEFVTSTVVASTEAAESAALDRIMDEVADADGAFRGMTGDDRQRAEHQADVDEAVFMSQFLPRR